MAFDKLAWQREYRKTRSDWDCKKYEKTPKGFLVRAYRNMESRVKGIQKRQAQYYTGLEILPREEFYKWAFSTDSGFQELYDAWKTADYDRKLSPSVDRPDVYKGYTLDNMQWITHSENSRKLTRRKVGEDAPTSKYTEQIVRRVRTMYESGLTLQQVGEANNIPMTTVHAIVKRRVWKHVA